SGLGARAYLPGKRSARQPLSTISNPGGAWCRVTTELAHTGLVQPDECPGRYPSRAVLPLHAQSLANIAHSHPFKPPLMFESSHPQTHPQCSPPKEQVEDQNHGPSPRFRRDPIVDYKDHAIA